MESVENMEDSASVSADSAQEEEKHILNLETKNNNEDYIDKKIPLKEQTCDNRLRTQWNRSTQRGTRFPEEHVMPSSSYSVLGVIKMPIIYLREGLENYSHSSFFLWSSVIAVIMLVLSATYMMYRVETLTRQLDGTENINYDNVYEEVLHMQQKLHAGTAEEVEKTLGTQLRQITMIRESLESLSYLFNKEISTEERISENVKET